MTFLVALFAPSNTYAQTPDENISVVKGEHKCNDECKKDEKGNCLEAKATANGEQKANGKSCCKEGDSCCHGKKGKGHKKGKRKGQKNKADTST